MKKRITTIQSLVAAIGLVLIMSCSSETERQKCLDFLFGAMPLPDRLIHSQEWWGENVDKTLEVREKMGWDVPEREFMHFVLPLRVNNEALDDFRLIYADSLCARVEGMDMAQAALEINHWCHERAVYRPSDARTSSPMATIRAGAGRCGEESVLAVAALRAAGIPARQVYTPRWAHTDDNHAWVEVYVDGGWHFMGACEPEPVLDRAWFNSSVSRALLLHTKAFGDYRSDEDVISRTSAYTEVNVVRGYVPARKTVVKVIDSEGNPVSGARVDYRIYNYAEYYPVASYLTATEGTVSLDTGFGDLMVTATKDGSFGIAKASSELVTVILDHRAGDSFTLDFDIVSPPENPLPSSASDEQLASNAVRLAAEDSLRATLPHGNEAVTNAFLEKHGPLASAILASLSLKDWNDVTSDVLEDAAQHCQDGTFDKWRDSPRIELEPLHPFFSEIGEGLEFASPMEVHEWVCDSIAVDDNANPQGLRIPPLFVWRWRVADSRSRDIFFVALCRKAGFRARIDEVTGKAQYLSGDVWNDVVLSAESPKGSLALHVPEESSVADPEYYTHFTISRIDAAGTALLSFDEGGPLSFSSLFSEPYPLDEGWYMLTTGRRLADGSVLSRVSFFEVREGTVTDQDLVIRSSESVLEVIGSFDAEQLFTNQEGRDVSILSATGRGYFIMAVLGSGDEPSDHAARQLAAASSDINAWGRPVLLLKENGGRQAHTEPAVAGIDNVIYGFDRDGRVASMLASSAGPGTVRLPIVAVGDSFGRLVYVSQGYNTSLAEDLRLVIDKINN